MSDQWLVDGLPIEGDWTPAPPCTPGNGPTGVADNIIITGAPGSITSMVNDKSLWALVLNDGTPAADFRIDRFDDTGALASSPMTIVRATGVVTFNDPVMLAEDPLAPLEAATKNYVDAHAAGLTDAPNDGTLYGRKSLAWSHLTHADITDWAAALAAASYIGDAPSDTTTYARNDAAWVHLTHTDITDWATALAPYALAANIPVGSSSTPLMDGAGAAGSATAWARGDHVHPTDTTRAAVSAIPAASTTTPAMDGTAAVGTGATWARADHVHPVDTSRYAASNPSGYQTAAQVTASLGGYLPLIGGTLTGPLTPSAGIVGDASGGSAPAGAIGEVISSNNTAVALSSGVTANITSITLTAGDWDIQGEVWFSLGVNGASALHGGINTVSATIPTASGVGSSRASIIAAFSASQINVLSLRPCRVSLAAPATYYLAAQVGSTGNTNGSGNIWARRAR